MSVRSGLQAAQRPKNPWTLSAECADQHKPEIFSLATVRPLPLTRLSGPGQLQLSTLAPSNSAAPRLLLVKRKRSADVLPPGMQTCLQLRRLQRRRLAVRYVRVSEVGGSRLARTGTDSTAERRGPRLQSKPAGNRAADASSEGNDATDNPDARFDSRDLWGFRTRPLALTCGFMRHVHIR